MAQGIPARIHLTMNRFPSPFLLFPFLDFSCPSLFLSPSFPFPFLYSIDLFSHRGNIWRNSFRFASLFPSFCFLHRPFPSSLSSPLLSSPSLAFPFPFLVLSLSFFFPGFVPSLSSFPFLSCAFCFMQYSISCAFLSNFMQYSISGEICRVEAYCMH